MPDPTVSKLPELVIFGGPLPKSQFSAIFAPVFHANLITGNIWPRVDEPLWHVYMCLRGSWSKQCTCTSGSPRTLELTPQWKHRNIKSLETRPSSPIDCRPPPPANSPTMPSELVCQDKKCLCKPAYLQSRKTAMTRFNISLISATESILWIFALYLIVGHPYAHYKRLSGVPYAHFKSLSGIPYSGYKDINIKSLWLIFKEK